MSRTFDELSDFIRNQMRMSHIYQPVMLMELLKGGGSASTRDIAKALLVEDISQIEYYERITKNMVGRVLTRNRGITEKQGDSYHLKGFDDLSVTEVEELFGLCADEHKSFVERRGDRIWSHRKKSSGYISGTLRYEILKRQSTDVSCAASLLRIRHLRLTTSCHGTKEDQTTRPISKPYATHATP